MPAVWARIVRKESETSPSFHFLKPLYSFNPQISVSIIVMPLPSGAVNV